MQDISPEDLFPPVSFKISDRDDADMPYTKPKEAVQEAKPRSNGPDSKSEETVPEITVHPSDVQQSISELSSSIGKQALAR